MAEALSCLPSTVSTAMVDSLLDAQERKGWEAARQRGSRREVLAKARATYSDLSS